MSPKTSSPYQNYLLQTLSEDDLALLSPKLETLELHERHECEKTNRPIKHIYFPESGIASVVARGPRQKPLEIGLIGREGMSGLVVLMGNDRSPHEM
jgi:CRP-like cAMP-binding protein